MTVKTAGFVTRAEMGMRRPDGVSNNITPNQGGVAIHHGGPGPNPAPTTLAKAIEVWLGWQKYHMDKKGWNDIAYSFGITQTGHVLAGRGLNVRTAAQGTNQGNDDYYAAVWIGGGGDSPTQLAYDAFDWVIYHARDKGNAGSRVKPHRYFTSTTCPDDKLATYALSRDGKILYLPLPSGGVTPKPVPPAFPLPSNHWFGIDDGTRYSHSGKLSRGRDDYWVRRIQKRVGTAVDGDFGPKTARAVVAWLNRHGGTAGLGDPKKVGPKVWKKLWA